MCMYVCVDGKGCNCPRRPEGFALPETRVLAVVSGLMWGLGTDLRSSARAVCTPNHCAMCLAASVLFPGVPTCQPLTYKLPAKDLKFVWCVVTGGGRTCSWVCVVPTEYKAYSCFLISASAFRLPGCPTHFMPFTRSSAPRPPLQSKHP